MATPAAHPGATAPLPPPPLPPPEEEEDGGSKKLNKALAVLQSYPDLEEHEEVLAGDPYNVIAWHRYTSDVDDLLDELLGVWKDHSTNTRGKDVAVGGRIVSSLQATDRLRELRRARTSISERALTLLPGSYKLWQSHLGALTRCLPQSCGKSQYSTVCSAKFKRFRRIVSAYERALVRLHKMPRIWLDYAAFVQGTYPGEDVTQMRRLYDRALLALPATQHSKVWGPYLQWAASSIVTETSNISGVVAVVVPVPHETSLRILRRHAQCFDVTAREQLAETCIRFQRWNEAASLYLDILNDADFLSTKGTTRHELWMKLAELCTHHPTEIPSVDFDAICRAAIGGGSSSSGGNHKNLLIFDESDDHKKGSTDQGDGNDETDEKKKQQEKDDHAKRLEVQLGEMEGTLWTKLADYHTRAGEFELARSIYEEALEQVSRVRDFSLLFDAYMKFEESVIEALMQDMNDDDDDDEMKEEEAPIEEEAEDDLDILLGETENHGTDADVELALARAEHLTARRPLLLNGVLLRQNPHNVGEWLRRSELYLKMDQPDRAAMALMEASQKVHARRAINGMPSTLFITLASIYEDKLQQLDQARNVFSDVCHEGSYHFKEVDDLAQCHAAWVELELRQENWDEALSIARQSVVPSTTKMSKGLSKSLRLWNLLLDLEESLGTVQTARDAYDRSLDLKVATPTHVLNFATFLTDRKYFEESFKAYERGVDLFAFPHAGAIAIWKTYLQAFLDRYQGTQMPRTRELFDRCLETCPSEAASEFFILYGAFEEQYGLTKRALGVYERMCTTVPPEEKYTAYQLYIAKTVHYLGVTATRVIYERAISALEDAAAAQMCCAFSQMETSLQEIDRARTVLTYGAQMADPRRSPEYWKEWHEFEVAHGNEETFREMLRVKRGVQAAFSTVNYNAAEMGAGATTEGTKNGVSNNDTLTNEEALDMIANREGVNVHEKQPRIGGFVQGKRTAEMADLGEVERRAARLRQATADRLTTATAAGNGGENDQDEIDIDEEEDATDNDGPPPPPTGQDAIERRDDAGGVRDVSTKAIPAAVFGGLAQATGDGAKVGALERLRAAARENSKAQQ